jgi:hypothetical protein
MKLKLRIQGFVKKFTNQSCHFSAIFNSFNFNKILKRINYDETP